VVSTVLSAIMTLVVPRALPVAITRWVFRGVRALFRLSGSRARSFEAQAQARDRDLALYGPLSLFALAATWLVLTGTGYMLLFWLLEARPLREALVLSGSSIYTQGFAVPATCRPRCWPSPRPGSAWCCWLW
jgi:hypothetical protein